MWPGGPPNRLGPKPGTKQGVGAKTITEADANIFYTVSMYKQIFHILQGIKCPYAIF